MVERKSNHFDALLRRSQHRVNDMHNPVIDQHVSLHDRSVVHLDLAIHQRNLQTPAVHGRHLLPVLQKRRVRHRPVDNVVGQHVGERGTPRQTAAVAGQGAESGIVGREDGDVLECVDCSEKLGLDEGASECGEAGSGGGGSDVGGDAEDAVDDVDDAAVVECDVLRWVVR